MARSFPAHAVRVRARDFLARGGVGRCTVVVGMRYGLLGSLEVSDDGSRTVALAHGRQRLLVAVLLLHANEVLSSDRLIDALWGEAPPATAPGSLHNLVHGVRKALGNGELVTRDHGYVLEVAPGE